MENRKEDPNQKRQATAKYNVEKGHNNGKIRFWFE